ncbi:MAG: hypothetical protein GY832_42885 [Chloroflexi bacterium]|nr:hypothetical protein [Chloroflexota bacterium]
MESKTRPISGAYALARGAIGAGVSLVTGYPGSPTTSVVNAIREMTEPDEVQVEWTSNEKVAIEMAFGASVGGTRALLCVKSVGLNIALDPLMALNLSGCNAGLVILVGDDPGSWGSQNEQDSRILAQMAEIPLLEPATVSDAWDAMLQAFQLSEETGMPVIVRITRALSLAQEIEFVEQGVWNASPPAYQREIMRWVVLPINVVSYHRRLLQRLHQVQTRFENSRLNKVEGNGPQKIIAAGFAYQKLLDVLGNVPSELGILKLGTYHPLPTDWMTVFLRKAKSVLVLEETAPLIERAVRAVAQRARLTLPIYGRDSGHIPRAGELFPLQIATALNRFLPHLALPTEGETARPRPSRQPLCEGCPYSPTLDALFSVIEQSGGRDEFIIVGDPGCMVRAQLPPYKLLDVKTSLGSSIGTAVGIALSQTKNNTGKRVIALCGDSAFLHSGLNGLIDAAQIDANMLVLVLDNGTTALSGGQPHPASQTDARGTLRHAVELAALVRAASVGDMRAVDLDRGDDVQAAIEAGINFNGLSVVIARGQCPRWTTNE